ncbi:DUF3467 domain-containing protein [Porphyromonas pogonae]|uniref:DUF3467 domain-containing protein n=1 Tax=Porphyromonas pogonae TaxID=867595 RepID=UPI002E76CB1C|nr:DUF3467 domain-containing protein [Porphyromonas pogonae]
MDKNIDTENQSFNIELPDDIAQGIYSNLAIVMHSQSEFVMDFVRMIPGKPSAKVFSRIIMTPDNVKRLINTLQQNVVDFEAQHGKINLEEEQGAAGVMKPPHIKGEA